MYTQIRQHNDREIGISKDTCTGKVTALGVLCCFALFVCLTLLASFFLPSHLSFKNMYKFYYVHVHVSDGACENQPYE